MTTRREKDPLGPLDVPDEALYGVQTLRAKQNFPISGLAPLWPFVRAQVWIKKAAALTHKATGRRLSGRDGARPRGPAAGPHQGLSQWMTTEFPISDAATRPAADDPSNRPA